MVPNFEEVLQFFEKEEKSYNYFCGRISSLLIDNPDLEKNGMQLVHSVKQRKKSRSSIISKCERKFKNGKLVSPENAAQELEDFFGIRLLHIHFDQVEHINSFLHQKANSGDFFFGEKPIAYTWDPEHENKLKGLGFEVKFKDSYYTSLHYILRVSQESPIRCELQVRTLFEEAWGELDHWMNYPYPTEILALKEQLLVLSRVVTAGSRLAVSINRIYENSLHT